MSAFRIERAELGSHEVFDLYDDHVGRHVRIALRGAGVMLIAQKIGESMHPLTDGFRDSAELDSRPSSRFAVMAPFANRIDDARYEFDGISYDLAPGVEGAERASRHGFVRGVDFELGHISANDTSAKLTLKTSVIRPGTFPGYPFAIDLSVHYTLDTNGLTLEAVMQNVGDKAAPCFFGWHPYFRLGDTSVDSWHMQLPATQMIAMDKNAIPLAGDAAYVPLESAPKALDFRQSHAIGDTKIDQGYADVTRDADGRVRSHLRDPSTGIGITMWQERGVVLAFTADTITRDVRRSVAIEPMESMSNAFNRPDCAQAIRLEPGAERRFRCGVDIHVA